MATIDINPGPQRIPSGPEHAVLMPPEFGMAAGIFGAESLMRRMMRDPWLGLADAMIRALVLEGEHRVVPAIGELPDDAAIDQRRDKEIADRIADGTRGWIERLRRPFRRTLWHSLEAHPYGHKLCEVEWGVVERGPFRGQIAPADIAPKPRTSYEFKLDKANRIVSVRPTGGRVDGSGDVPPESLFVFSLAGRDDHPAGTPALERAYEAWYRKGCAKPLETKSLAAFAGGIAWAEADKEAKATIDVRMPDGTVETRHSAQVVADEAAKIKVGRVGAFPPGWSYKQFPPAASFGAFDSSYGRSDREMVTALFVAARAVMESEFGSRADSQTAEGMVSSVRDWLRGELCEAVRSQPFRTYVLANYGEEYVHLTPSYVIATEERDDLGKVATAIQTLFAADVLTPELVDHLLTLVGVPESVRRAVVAAFADREVASEADPQPATSDKPKGRQFADDRVDARKAAAADRQTGRIVRRYDKKLRNVAAKWLDQKLTDDAFLSRFSDLLTSGHEEAARLGARLAGHTADRLPVAVREYVAATLGDETEHLRDLLDEVAAGTRTANQARLAARRYSQRLGGTVSAAFHEASPHDAEFYWVLGAAEHCKDCPRLAEMSPILKDELITRPREGETECRGGCVCRLVRADGAVGPGPVALGDYDE